MPYLKDVLAKSDFKKWPLAYRICDACAELGEYPRKRVDYVTLNKSEGGRFMFANIGLCADHYEELKDE